MSQSNTSKNEYEIVKINHNGQQGYFISIDYWTEIDLIITEYRILQKNYILLEKENELLYEINTRLQKKLKYEHVKNNFLAGSIGLNISLTALVIGGISIFYYNK
jgi:hypothetical protein